jgi:hypothetical protein
VALVHEFLEQLDDRLHDDFEVAEGRLARTSDGRVIWAADAHQDGHDQEARVYEVWSATGEQIHRSGAATVLPPVALGATTSSSRYETVVANSERWRTLAAPVTIGGHILDNAIKYGPVGSTVTIAVDRNANDGVLAITDEGPGVPAEHRERIFHRFFRLDEARSRDGGGAGLGLAIAKWAVEIHGGRITVNGRQGGGSEFLIHRPLADSSPAAEEPGR